ncbi:MAG TPA: hypothetical protein PLD73_13305 [Candidatus Hydrogenedentes bacterium]|jgi:hypothetical protein|nr:hypothetical protein [Candidatus Hydrogenedentota bacterium]
MKKNRALVLTGVLCTLLASVALAQPSTPPTNFEALPGFPGPDADYESVGVDALRTGELVVYDGATVYLEDGVDEDEYTAYTGYDGAGEGLAGFVAASPNGSTALIGAYGTGDLWLFDADAPTNAGEPYGTVPGVLFGEYLNNTQVLVSVYLDEEIYGKQNGPGILVVSELGIVDTANTNALYTKVVDMGMDGIPGGSVVVGRDVYTTNAATGQIRSFRVADLLDPLVYKPLAWEDGALVGTFNDFGPTAASSKGTLLVSGNDATTGRGAIQFVSTDGIFGGDAQMAYESDTAAHIAVYNPRTSKVIAVVLDDSGEAADINAWVSVDRYEPTTFFGGILALLAGLGGFLLLLILLLGFL